MQNEDDKGEKIPDCPTYKINKKELLIKESIFSNYTEQRRKQTFYDNLHGFIFITNEKEREYFGVPTDILIEKGYVGKGIYGGKKVMSFKEIPDWLLKYKNNVKYLSL